MIDDESPAKPRLDACGPAYVRAGGCSIFTMNVVRDITYRVLQVERHVFDLGEPALADAVGRHPALIAVDEAVLESPYGTALRAYAALRLGGAQVLRVRRGESNKTWDQVAQICSAAMDSHVPRDGVLVGVGGGVVLDVAGVAASLYRRGIAYVRVPTTLLGMIDVAVGVKHGINFRDGKNILGTFYPPLCAIVDATFLQTVTRRDLASGIAEAIKIALVADEQLFGLLEAHAGALIASGFREPAAVAREVLERSQIAMMHELAPNLFEADLQRAVDFGHSISPALEARSHYALTHGEAVAIDMLLATAIAVQRYICPQSLFDRLVHVYSAAGLPMNSALCTPQMLRAALDEARRHRGGTLNFVVPRAIGACAFLQHVEDWELRDALHSVQRVANGVYAST